MVEKAGAPTYSNITPIHPPFSYRVFSAHRSRGHPFPLDVGFRMVNSLRSGHIACRCDTTSIIAPNEIPGWGHPNFAHSYLTDSSASTIRVCMFPGDSELARDRPSAVDTWRGAASKLHHSSPCISAVDTRAYTCISSRDAWGEASGGARNRYFALLFRKPMLPLGTGFL